VPNAGTTDRPRDSPMLWQGRRPELLLQRVDPLLLALALSGRAHRSFAARYDAGEGHDGDYHQGLQDDEGHGAPIDVLRRQGSDQLAGHTVAISPVGRDRAQVEERIAERGVHEAR